MLAQDGTVVGAPCDEKDHVVHRGVIAQLDCDAAGGFLHVVQVHLCLDRARQCSSFDPAIPGTLAAVDVERAFSAQAGGPVRRSANRARSASWPASRTAEPDG
jgi:hypothetical protein